jgi:hypothetical protein
MMRVKRFLRRYKYENRMRLIGPELRRRHLARQGVMGIMPDHIYMPGRVGIVGRSGTLGYEAASQLKALGLGVSTSVGIGGDPINGSSFRDILELFENDPETDAVMMIGEIGGPQEAEAARYWAENMKKPLVAYVAGLSAPKGRKMGHAGAIISAFGESAQEKVDILSELGVAIAPNPSSMGETVARSEILAVTPKSGGTGEMVFVRVKHMIEGENGAFIEEEQDIVYLHIPEAYTPPNECPRSRTRISTRPCRSTRRGFSVFRRPLTMRTASITICPTRGRWRNIPPSSRTGRCRRSC